MAFGNVLLELALSGDRGFLPAIGDGRNGGALLINSFRPQT